MEHGPYTIVTMRSDRWVAEPLRELAKLGPLSSHPHRGRRGSSRTDALPLLRSQGSWSDPQVHCFVHGPRYPDGHPDFETLCSQPRTIADIDRRCRAFVETYEWALFFWADVETYLSYAFVSRERTSLSIFSAEPCLYESAAGQRGSAARTNPPAAVLTRRRVDMSIAEVAQVAFVRGREALAHVLWQACECQMTGAAMLATRLPHCAGGENAAGGSPLASEADGDVVIVARSPSVLAGLLSDKPLGPRLIGTADGRAAELLGFTQWRWVRASDGYTEIFPALCDGLKISRWLLVPAAPGRDPDLFVFATHEADLIKRFLVLAEGAAGVRVDAVF